MSLLDSPLSITASITGILTFIFAIFATLYVRLTYLRNADSEYFQVKASLSWYKTESAFMQDLINTPPSNLGIEKNGEREKEIYGSVVEQLRRLEERLLECLVEAEDGAMEGGGDEEGAKKKTGWTIVPRRMRGRTDIAMTWLPVRAKALELVRQRDALGSRVLFAQMSMISSRVRDQESRAKERDERIVERLRESENLAREQHEKLDRLEGLVYRAMHRDPVALDGGSPTPERAGLRDEQPILALQNGDSDPAMQYDNVGNKSPTHQPKVAARVFTLPST